VHTKGTSEKHYRARLPLNRKRVSMQKSSTIGTSCRELIGAGNQLKSGILIRFVFYTDEFAFARSFCAPHPSHDAER
jgi:hypothetical protein